MKNATRFNAIIIHPNEKERATLRSVLEAGIALDCVEYASHEEALRGLEGNEKPIHFILDVWRLSQEGEDFIRLVRQTKGGRDTLHIKVASPEDYGWLSNIFHTAELLDEVFTTPRRHAHLVQTAKQKIAVDPMAKPCALLVEDDDQARAILRQYLISFGFSKVVEASDGQQALEILNTGKRYLEFSLVVSDWHMPRMTGIDLLRNIRQKPWLSRLPFVIITASSPAEPIKTLQAAEMGVAGYLLKPFSSKTFQSQMDGIVHEIKKHRQAEAYLIVGRTLLAMGDHFHAEEAFNEGAMLFPQESSLWEAIGDAQVLRARETKNHAPAAESYERALKLNPANVTVLMKYFEVACTAGKMNEAVRVLRGHLHRSDLEDTLRVKLGKVYLENGEVQAAKVQFSRALACNPTNSEAQALIQKTDPAPVRKAG